MPKLPLSGAKFGENTVKGKVEDFQFGGFDYEL